MKIAILGASSQIAKDFIVSISENKEIKLFLFARRPEIVSKWLATKGLLNRYFVMSYEEFSVSQDYDSLINFVGVGDPAKAVLMGTTIFDVTLKYDDLALDYVKSHPNCRYIFLSSGAAYGGNFERPVQAISLALIPLNSMAHQDWYGLAKLHAEGRHRANSDMAIVDLRVFNYFSHTQDMNSSFFITEIARTIRNKMVLKTNDTNIVRDFLHPIDFYQLVMKILVAPKVNLAIDCYSQAPIDKMSLLSSLNEAFGLEYVISAGKSEVNATGKKIHYYSTNYAAEYCGYKPVYTSLKCVKDELSAYLELNI
jgi:nucleoside-diphosphate-sugar epimerase